MLALSKLIGAALKIPLTNILGGLGMGYYSAAHSLFSPIYALTAAALPAVIMRLTAQNAASGRYNNVRRIRRAGLFAAAGLGLAGTVGVLIIAKPFSTYVAGSPNSLPAMLVIAPSLVLCAVSAVYRGYYEGLSNMLPTAISQIIEAVIKASIGIVLAYYVLAKGGGVPYAAAAAILGAAIGEFFALIFLWARTRLVSHGITPLQLQASPAPQRKRAIIKTILSESLPITVAALAMNLNPLIDLLTIPNLINASLANPSNKQFYLNNFTYGAHGGESLNDIGNFIYGSYTGLAIPIFAIAIAITALLGKSAVPEITAAYAARDERRLTRALFILFKGTFIAGLPLCLGLAALARPVLSLLYFSRPAEVLVSTPPLIILGLGGFSLILASVLFGVFLSIGRVDLQIKLMTVGAVIKLAVNLLLIPNPQINAAGAAVSSVLCYSFISIAGLILLKRALKTDLNIPRLMVKPLLFSLLCAVTAWICHNHLFTDRSAPLNLAMSTAAGGLVYLTLTMFSDRKAVRTLLRPQLRRRHQRSAQIPHR